MKIRTTVEEFKFKILQHVSGNYLVEYLPENWEEMTEEDQNDFLTDHAWEPIECADPSFIYEAIDDAARSLERFLQYQGITEFVCKPNLKVRKVCCACGSEDVSNDALAVWSKAEQEWVVGGLLDDATCNHCGNNSGAVITDSVIE